jgi:protein gp37
MSFESSIEWTDSTWNPVRGCTKISPGCKYCYAEVFAERFRGVPGRPGAYAKVPFFFKQWGGIRKRENGRVLDGRMHDEFPDIERSSVPVSQTRFKFIKAVKVNRIVSLTR